MSALNRGVTSPVASVPPAADGGGVAPVEPLTLHSRFAERVVDAREVIAFPDGVPGYEGTRRFALLDLEELAPIKVLHAVNAPEPCFLVVDPRAVLPTFRGELSAADRLRLGASDDSTLLWLAIVIMDAAGEIAVNLRAPIVIDPARMIGRQVMPNACLYPMRYVIEPDGSTTHT